MADIYDLERIADLSEAELLAWKEHFGEESREWYMAQDQLNHRYPRGWRRALQWVLGLSWIGLLLWLAIINH